MEIFHCIGLVHRCFSQVKCNLAHITLSHHYVIVSDLTVVIHKASWVISIAKWEISSELP